MEIIYSVRIFFDANYRWSLTKQNTTVIIGSQGRVASLIMMMMFQEEPRSEQGAQTISALASKVLPGSGLLLSTGAVVLL